MAHHHLKSLLVAGAGLGALAFGYKYVHSGAQVAATPSGGGSTPPTPPTVLGQVSQALGVAAAPAPETAPDGGIAQVANGADIIVTNVNGAGAAVPYDSSSDGSSSAPDPNSTSTDTTDALNATPVDDGSSDDNVTGDITASTGILSLLGF